MFVSSFSSYSQFPVVFVEQTCYDHNKSNDNRQNDNNNALSMLLLSARWCRAGVLLPVPAARSISCHHLQDHHRQLFLCSPLLPFKSCSSMFLCSILGSYISGVQDRDVTSEAAVFILMSSLHPLAGVGRVLSNGLMLRDFKCPPYTLKSKCSVLHCLFYSLSHLKRIFLKVFSAQPSSQHLNPPISQRFTVTNRE